MEIHHIKTDVKEKHFKHYFFEFFMLFLAISLGFFVENIREHITENRREKEYIATIAEDIKADIHNLDSIIKLRNTRNAMMDSLLDLLNSPNPNEHGSDVYYYSRWLPRTNVFFTEDRTLLQLNAGNWRLIRNNNSVDALLRYNRMVRLVQGYIEHREESIVLQLYPLLQKLFNNRVFETMISGMTLVRPSGNPQLISTDKASLNEFCNQIHFAKNANLYYTLNCNQVIKEAHRALSVLKEEYHIK